MDLLGIIILIILFALCFLSWKMADDSDYDEDMPTLINVLKNEDKVLFPIGISMLGYQIYKSGKWGLAPETYSYIVVFWYIMNICLMLGYKFYGNRNTFKNRFLFVVCYNIVFTPVTTIICLIAVILGAK